MFLALPGTATSEQLKLDNIKWRRLLCGLYSIILPCVLNKLEPTVFICLQVSKEQDHREEQIARKDNECEKRKPSRIPVLIRPRV
jgi:hypothetical protein